MFYSEELKILNISELVRVKFGQQVNNRQKNPKMLAGHFVRQVLPAEIVFIFLAQDLQIHAPEYSGLQDLLNAPE